MASSDSVCPAAGHLLLAVVNLERHRASGEPIFPASSARQGLRTLRLHHLHRPKKVEMLFALLERILKLDRLRLRGPNRAKDEFPLGATAQNLRKMAKLLPMPALAMAG